MPSAKRLASLAIPEARAKPWRRSGEYDVGTGRGAELPRDADVSRVSPSHDGRTLVLEPREWPADVPRIDARLSSQTSFKQTLAGLDGTGGFALFADLRELRLQFAARQDRWIGEAIRRIPGFASLLSIAMRVRGDEESGYELFGFVRMARTPVGFAKALSIEAAPLALPDALRSAGYSTWAVQRVEAGVIADSIKLALGMTGLGVFGPNPGVIAQRFGGFLFRRDFWESCGPEWGVGVDRKGRGVVLINRLRDREALMSVLRDLAAKPPMRSSIEIERVGEVDYVVAEFFGQSFLACVGPQVAALDFSLSRLPKDHAATRSTLERLASARLQSFDAKRAGFPKAPKALNGIFELDPEALDLRGAPRSMRMWTQRGSGGIRIRGRLVTAR